MSRTVWQLPNHQYTFPHRPLVMGIVNVTPDSFSDGGQFADCGRAVAHGLELAGLGADIIDVGGESTRPNADIVPVAEELRRVVPVVEKLAQQITIPISIDTSKAAVAREGLAAGAAIINDVTALTGDADMIDAAKARNAGVILMHMQGTPRTMQQNPTYEDVVTDIIAYLAARFDEAVSAGISPQQLVIDPGIGFGKTLEHNLQILARLAEFRRLERPLCLGASRKGFIRKILNCPVDGRQFGLLAIHCHAMSQKAVDIVRVHDVAAAREAVLMWETLCSNALSGSTNR